MAKVTFGIIALNALPLLRYNLQALYPFAHQIIVVEGAVRSANQLAQPNGHSQDGTWEMLQDFARQHDPEHKLHLVSAADEGYADGFWPEKDEMSQAYAKRATGDWLWQVDSDEFYQEQQMAALLEQLDADTSVSGCSFPYIEFFGSFDSHITGEWHRFAHPRFYRLFRWGPGYRYASHRPPTVLDAQGRNLHQLHWLASPRVNGRPMFLYHYSYVFPKQARQKVGYYSNVTWSDAFRDNKTWYEQQYVRLQDPLHLGELRGWQWLERFGGRHPRSIQQLQADLAQGRIQEELRPTADIERLLAAPGYRIQTWLAHAALWLYWPLRVAWKRVRSWVIQSFT